MATTSMAWAESCGITVGVDTHLDVHVARAKDHLGRPLGEKSIATTPAGYQELAAWAAELGPVQAFGIEGTGSYGAGLARHLRAGGHTVIEVGRPSRQARRANGKSDPADADAAASAVLSGDARAIPKAGDAEVEMIRCLRIARSTAIKARIQATNAMKALVVTAAPSLREQLRALSTKNLVATCARLRPGPLEGPEAATKIALGSLAARAQGLEAEARELRAHLDKLTTQAAPRLRQRVGVGPDCAAALLLAAGDNPDRLRSESAFSMLCGASPVEASSGKVTRHRLNRGGDRQANAALYRIVLVRLRYDSRTQEYVQRRTKEGMSKIEIMRCLKRYVAREVYQAITDAPPTPSTPETE